MPKSKAAGFTRRQMLKVGGTATFAGYAVGVEKAFGQAIKTDTQGHRGRRRGGHDRRLQHAGLRGPALERPAHAPIVIVISEIWGVHEWVQDVHPPLRQGRLLRGGPRAVQAGGRRGPHPERPGHPEDRARGAAQAGARRRRGRSGLDQEAARSARGPRRRDRTVLGRLHRVPGGGHQPRHQGGGGVVRPAGPALPRHAEPGDRLRRGQGHQGAVPGSLRREGHEPDARRTPRSSASC